MTSRPRTIGGRGAFTLVEAMITLLLMTVVFGGLARALSSARRSFREGSTYMQLEAEGSRVMSRIVGKFRAARLDSLSPLAAPPFSSEVLNFQRAEGFDGKETTWSDTERVFLDPAAGTVSWASDPGTADEQVVVWSRRVSDFLEDELFDGTDTNGNGLQDERGLCFTREGDLLTIRMTLEAVAEGGGTISRSWTARIHCRN